MAKPTRVLFVDDEPTIRLTLPKILEMHEFDVKAAANVQDALKLIQEEKFDVLLSDLNIGAPSDGFTVVSAMRRVQPDVVTIILTGYPAFESALQAIREQVDDYISKPANVDELVNTIKSKVRNRTPHALQLQMPTCEALEKMRGKIMERFVEVMRAGTLPVQSLQDEEIVNDIPVILDALIEHLRHASSGHMTTLKQMSAEHGRLRRKQGFAVQDLVEENRMLRNVVYLTIQGSLLQLNTSALVPDMVRVGDFLLMRLRESVEAFAESENRKPSSAKKAAKRALKSRTRVRRAS